MKFHTFTTSILSIIIAHASAQSGGVWEPESPLPTNGEAKTHAIGLVQNNIMFVLGGTPWMNPGSMEDGTVYSMPVGGSVWTEEAGFDGLGGIIGQGGGIDALDRIIIFGGEDPKNPGKGDPPFEWNVEEGPWRDHADRSALAPLTNFAFCTDDAGMIYSIGGGPGGSASSFNPNSTYCERFDGVLDLWEPIAPLPFAISNAAACLDGIGHILVFGGITEDGSARTDGVLSYDISTNTWSSSANTAMPFAVSDHQATLGSDGRIYVLGGTVGAVGSPVVVSDVSIYDPVTDQWVVGPAMTHPRRDFASLLGTDDRLYVFGGLNNTGGTAHVESMYTTPCVIFTSQPAEQTVWENTALSLSANNSGGGIVTYQWSHEGVALNDGTTTEGSEIVGSQTDTLRIDLVSASNGGCYSLAATNSCGTVVSDSATITVQMAPVIPNQWSWTSLHPSYAEHSYAQGVDNGTQVGRAVFDTPEFNNIDHPMRWSGTAASGVNLTPIGSQGGSISDIAGNKLVGWWWEPLSCYVNHQWQTCYYRRGGWWELDGTFHLTNYSGYEYTTMNATDGISIVGTGTTDDDVGNVYSKGVIWNAPTHEYATSVHPSEYRGSGLSAIDGDHQFGTLSLPFQGLHAGMWSGVGGGYVDMHPNNAVTSSVVDASDGQQVGMLDQWQPSPRAVLWTGTMESMVELTPTAATGSIVLACDSGLQIGTVLFDGDPIPHNGIWTGAASTFVDLSGIVPVGYQGFFMQAVDVDQDGVISIVGSSFNTVLQRSEAILITSSDAPDCVGDYNGDGALDFFDISQFLSEFSANVMNADLNGDSQFDFFDISVFLQAFSNGCP